jgi:hypothetical protein
MHMEMASLIHKRWMPLDGHAENQEPQNLKHTSPAGETPRETNSLQKQSFSDCSTEVVRVITDWFAAASIDWKNGTSWQAKSASPMRMMMLLWWWSNTNNEHLTALHL